MLNPKTLRAACALPALALTAAAVPIGASASAPRPTRVSLQESVQAARRSDADATIVVRYDPSAIYLTGQLVDALCVSSVEITAPDGAAWEDEASSLRLRATAFADLERQPPGVFAGIARLEGPSIAAAGQEEALAIALRSLGDALTERLVEPRHRAYTGELQRLRARQDEMRDELALVVDQLEAAATREHVGRSVDAATADLRSLEVETDVAAGEWRSARNALEQRKRILADVSAERAKLAASVERLRALHEIGNSPTSELDEGVRKLDEAERKVAYAAKALELASAKVDATADRRNDLLARAEATKSELARLVEDAQRLDAEGTDRPGRDAMLSVRRQVLREALDAATRSIADVEMRLETLVPVTITRW